MRADSGGRGSCRARIAMAREGKAPAEPGSPRLGRARLLPSQDRHGSGGRGSCRARIAMAREGEAPAEPGSPRLSRSFALPSGTAAQQELRPPFRNHGSAGASPSLLEPRLSRSFALPSETAAQQELRPPSCRVTQAAAVYYSPPILTRYNPRRRFVAYFPALVNPAFLKYPQEITCSAPTVPTTPQRWRTRNSCLAPCACSSPK